MLSIRCLHVTRKLIQQEASAGLRPMNVRHVNSNRSARWRLTVVMSIAEPKKWWHPSATGNTWNDGIRFVIALNSPIFRSAEAFAGILGGVQLPELPVVRPCWHQESQIISFCCNLVVQPPLPLDRRNWLNLVCILTTRHPLADKSKLASCFFIRCYNRGTGIDRHKWRALSICCLLCNSNVSVWPADYRSVQR